MCGVQIKVAYAKTLRGVVKLGLFSLKIEVGRVKGAFSCCKWCVSEPSVKPTVTGKKSRTYLFISKFLVILPVASILTVLNGIFRNPISLIDLPLSGNTRQCHLLSQIYLEVLEFVCRSRTPRPTHCSRGLIVQAAVSWFETLVSLSFKAGGCDLAVCNRAIFHS